MNTTSNLTLEFPVQEARDILYGDHDDWRVIEDECVDTSGRWTDEYELVVQNIHTNEFYSSGYSRGSTEMQVEQPWEYEDKAVFVKVEPEEVTVIKYVEVKENNK